MTDLNQQPPAAPRRRARLRLSLLGALALLALATAMPRAARADFTVHVPLVVQGEREVESSAFRSRDPAKAKDGQAGYTVAAGYGVTAYWATELEGEWEHPAGGSTKFEEYEWENTLLINEPGEHWYTLGVLANYAVPGTSSESRKVELGPLVQAQWGTALHTLNVIFSKALSKSSNEEAEEEAREHGLPLTEAEEGEGGDKTQLRYAWQSRFRLTRTLDAGLELFADTGEAGKPKALKQQDVRVGPVLYGTFKPSTGTRVRWELGYLFGATDATPDGTLKAFVEVEFF